MSQSLRLALSTDRHLLCVSIELQGSKSMRVIRWSSSAGRVRFVSNESDEDGTKPSKHFHDAARHILGASDERTEPVVLATQPRAQLSFKMTVNRIKRWGCCRCSLRKEQISKAVQEVFSE